MFIFKYIIMKLCYITVSLTFILSQIDRAESSSLEETFPLLEEESINEYDRAEPSSLEETFRWLEIEGEMVKVCTTKECKRTAKMLKRFMYPKKNPCTDFYNFACGKFRFPAKFEGEVLLSGQQIRSNELNRKILSYLNSDNDHNIKAIEQIQSIFGLCKNEDSIRKFGDNVIESQLNIVELPLIPPFHPRPSTSKAKNFGRILAKIQRAAAIPFLFSVSVDKDIKDYSINRLYIQLDKFTISGYDDPEPEAMYYTQYSSNRKQKDYEHTYKNYMKRIVRHLYQSMNINIFGNYEKFASGSEHKVTEFLINVREAKDDKLYSNASYEYITMQDLQKKTDIILQKSDIEFNWQQYLLTLFENIYDVSTYFDSGQPLIVVKMKYLESIFEFISNISEEVFEAALWWVTVQDVISLADKKLRNLEKKFSEDINGFNYNRETICLCFAINKFSHALTHLLLKEINDPQKYIEEVAKINENVKISLIQIIHNAVWMDDYTRNEAINKIESIETFISHESWVESSQEIQQKYEKVRWKQSWYETKLELNVKSIEEQLQLLFVRNYSDEKKFDADPLYLNVVYNFIDNTVTIPLALLGLPNFNFGIHSMDYGVIASDIGNAFMRAFSKFGRAFDSSGHERNWWNKATLRKFKERQKCFVDFYNTFISRDEIIQIGGNLSPDQIIGDNVGLKLALSAYDMYVEKYGPEEQKLIDFEEYSSEQLLMLAIASSDYWDPGYYHLEERHKDDIHRRSPYRLKINGIFMNSDRMSEIWGCPVGMLMNPPEKCYMF